MEEKFKVNQVSDVYKGGFFKNRHKLSWRAPLIVKALINTFNLRKSDTIVDVGCAIGDYVKEFEDKGFMSYGIEGSEAAKPFFVSDKILIFDLRNPLIIECDYSLAYSFEVAEHIDPQYSRTYIENLTRLSSTILITAAPPGQKGHGHVNCQEKGWWEQEFKIFNYRRDKVTEQRFKDELSPYYRKEVQVYSKNVMVYRRNL